MPLCSILETLETLWIQAFAKIVVFIINDYKTLITFVHDKAFFSIMQNKTDKGTLLVSKSLPVANLSSVSRLFSARKKKCYVSSNEKKSVSRFAPNPPAYLNIY